MAVVLGVDGYDDSLFYFVGSEENDPGQENCGTFTCKATQKSSGTFSKSEGSESDCSHRESQRVCLSFKFRNSSFFSEFFKNFIKNVSFYCFSKEYSPFSWLESIFYPACHAPESLASPGCVYPPRNGNQALGCSGLLSDTASLTCICKTAFLCFFRTFHTLSPLCLFTCHPLPFGAHRSPVESNL